jgi:sulfatase modifying factor 1
MILVKGGSFLMGSEEAEARDNEKPMQEITLSDFYIGKYPVTQQLWMAVMGVENNPSYFNGYNRPVEQVSWNETQEFIKKLNKLSKLKYRLLTEAEWEYAARGGEKSLGFKYAGSNKLKDVAWFSETSYGETKPVGLKYPNELGLYDMSGNIYEWVADSLHGTYIGAPKDGFVWLADGVSAHIIRGGGWNYSAQLCRVSARSYFDRALKGEDYGFRLCLSLK